jgi:sec-independent protein translocase protein TatC
MLKRDDDYFKNTTMTFGEHLEELRSCLLKALLCLVVGTSLGLLVGNWVVAAITAPLSKALGTYYESEAVEDYGKWVDQQTRLKRPVPYTVEEIKDLVDREGLTFEIRYVHPLQVRPWIEAGAGRSGSRAERESPSGRLTGKDDLVPMFLWQPTATDARINPTTLSAQEAFAIWFKASLVVGAVLSSPLVFYFLWSFVAAGLYPHEKKYVYMFMPFSMLLFLAGAALAYVFVFEQVLNFLFSFNRRLELDPDPRITEWLGFVLFLPLGFGISFQLPLVMLFLERIGVFSVQSYLEKWRIAILVIFVLSAILTPADPYSLLFMAVPLTVLFFGGVLICHLWPRPEPLAGS